MNPTEKQRAAVVSHVTKYMERNQQLLPSSITENDANYSHIRDIAISIMCTKWKVGYSGGSFAQAVVDNNLTRTFATADDVCVQGIRFFVSMINNLDMPIEVVAARLNEDHDKYIELTKGLH